MTVAGGYTPTTAGGVLPVFAIPRRLRGEKGFVGEDAVEGGAAYVKLAGGAKFVASVEIKDVLDMVLDDRIEGEVFRVGEWCGRNKFVEAGGDGEVVRADDAIDRFEECAFKDGGKFTDIAGPAVLEKLRQNPRTEHYRTLLISIA